MLFGDVTDQTLHEFQNGNGFGNQLIIFMSIVMEGNEISIIAINAGCSNCRTTKIPADIFGDGFCVTFTGFCVNIESIGMIAIGGRFLFAEGITENGMKLIQQYSLERITQKRVIEMRKVSPLGLSQAAFGNQAMDVRVPL